MRVTIGSYKNCEGLIFFDVVDEVAQTLEKGFESTADAEMWARIQGYTFLTEAKREQMISELIDDEIKTIVNDYLEGDNSYINDIFCAGFKGYNNFSDTELVEEYEERFPERDCI